MQAVTEDLKQHGATLVALTPQVAEFNLTLVERHSLTFDMLSDPGNAYASELGLTHGLPDDLREVYSGFGIDLPKHNADDSWTLPIPARLVIDTGGIIRAADIDPDYTRRPEPQKTVEDVAALG